MRRRARRNARTLLGILCVALIATTASAETMLRVALSSDLRSINPGINRDSVTDWVMIHVVEGLVAVDAKLDPVPMLAQSWSVSADGREYLFKLRPSVRFHNGETMNAQHVVWSWQRLLDPKERWACRSWYDGRGDSGVHITAIEAPDALTVRFQLERADPLFIYRLAEVQCQVAVVHPQSADAQGRWRWPVGTGPYRLADWRRGRYVELDRFDEYSLADTPASGLAGRKQADVQKIRMMILPDPSAVKLAVLSGEIDIWPMTAAEALPELRRDPSVTLLEEDSRDWAVMLIQNQRGVLRNPAMRAAIASVLDPSVIGSSTMYVTRPARPYAVPVTAIDPAIAEHIPLAFQPKRTEELLREAGYSGEPIDIDVSRELGNYFNDAIVVHALLNRAGIKARIRSMDWATQLKRYWQRDYQLSLFGYSGRASAPLMYAAFVCDPSRRSNCVVYTPQALQILGKFAESDARDRWSTFSGELEQEIAQDRSIVGLNAPLRITAVRKGVTGYATWPLGMPRFWGVSVGESR